MAAKLNFGFREDDASRWDLLSESLGTTTLLLKNSKEVNQGLKKLWSMGRPAEVEWKEDKGTVFNKKGR
jgi:hypothetical protein